MHELSIAQALLDQIEAAARPRQALRVAVVSVSVGPLSGVEPELLVRAFEVARRARPVTVDTELLLETACVRVACSACGQEGPAAPNDLRCQRCASPLTRLTGGDELLMLRVEMDVPAANAA